MRCSRRRFLSTAAVGAASLSTTSAVSAATTAGSSDRATPSRPEVEPSDPVIGEAYGELELSNDDPYWAWEFPRFTDPAVIEYEVRAEDAGDQPDVLVLPSSDFEKYQTQIGSFPILRTETRDLGWLGTRTIPVGVYRENLNRSTLRKRWDQLEDWSLESIVELEALDCLTASEPTQAAHRVGTGQYQIVFDWTDDVLSEPGSDDVTVDVSIRARYEDREGAVDGAVDEVGSFYTTVSTDNSPVVDTMKPVAEEICSRVPPELGGVSVTDLNETAPRGQQAVAATRMVFTILDDVIGYRPAFVWDALDGAATWTRWAGSVLPVVSNVEQLIDDACGVAADDPDSVTGDVENMLMSLGILVTEFVMIKFGLVSRVASFAVRKTHTYLLGVVREVLGLKAYLALLRELFYVTKAGVRDVLGAIKAITREIAEAYDFFSRKEVELVNDMREEDLRTLQMDWDVNLGPFDPSPECHPD